MRQQMRYISSKVNEVSSSSISKKIKKKIKNYHNISKAILLDIAGIKQEERKNTN